MSRRFRLFKVFGIEVYLDWTWFILLLYEVQTRTGAYSSRAWNVGEVLSLFLIVLLHEFGHATACRSVGGVANYILLWPFGGIAYASPPPRAGALLWTIVAGPLVNVVLLPVLWLVVFLGERAGWPENARDVFYLAWSVQHINIAILFFNLLPIYPLDGGQILRALLWFPLGMQRSLTVAAWIGVVGGLVFVVGGLWLQDYWIAFIAIFLLSQCWRALRPPAPTPIV